jgi:antitoxin component of MazEF toxin-antitoxin module
MRAKVLEWGNSYGIRLSKADVEELGLQPGDEVVVDVKAKPGDEIDVSGLRSFPLGGLADEHDEVDRA